MTETSSTPTRTVGFIGAGKVGTALARHLLAAGDRVLLAGSGDPFLTQLVADAVAPGAEAVWPAEAAASDVVVLALPLGRIAELDPALFEGRIVVDATNHWESVDGHIDGLHEGAAGTSAWIAAQLPGARLVKAFGHLGYHDLDGLSRPTGHPERVALAAAGDDEEAVEAVAALIDRAGFDPVPLAPLAAGAAWQPGTAAFGNAVDAETLRRLVAPVPARRSA